MRRKRSLSLIEIMIVMLLLGFLLTGLLNTFYQALKKNIENRELKQTVLQLSLFEQTVKHLLTQTKKIGTDHNNEVGGTVLLIQFTPDVDIEWDRASEMEGMFYTTPEKQLCFVSWSESGKARTTVLLDKVDQVTCEFFDGKKKEWTQNWPLKTEDPPAMIKIKIKWRGKEIPFTFFPSNSKEQISYQGGP